MLDDLFERLKTEKRKLDQEKASKEKDLNRFLSDPSAFDSVSPAYLDRVQIVTENEIATLEDRLRKNNDAIKRADQDDTFLAAAEADTAEIENEELNEDLKRRKLLLQLIAAEKARRPGSQPQQLTREQERQLKFAETQARIDRIKNDKIADISRMKTQGEDKVSIHRRENMWDDALIKEEEELRKWL